MMTMIVMMMMMTIVMMIMMLPLFLLLLLIIFLRCGLSHFLFTRCCADCGVLCVRCGGREDAVSVVEDG